MMAAVAMQWRWQRSGGGGGSAAMDAAIAAAWWWQRQPDGGTGSVVAAARQAVRRQRCVGSRIISVRVSGGGSMITLWGGGPPVAKAFLTVWEAVHHK